MVAVVQWQSASLWKKMLWVRVPSATPNNGTRVPAHVYCVIGCSYRNSLPVEISPPAFFMVARMDHRCGLPVPNQDIAGNCERVLWAGNSAKTTIDPAMREIGVLFAAAGLSSFGVVQSFLVLIPTSSRGVMAGLCQAVQHRLIHSIQVAIATG